MSNKYLSYHTKEPRHSNFTFPQENPDKEQTGGKNQFYSEDNQTTFIKMLSCYKDGPFWNQHNSYRDYFHVYVHGATKNLTSEHIKKKICQLSCLCIKVNL